MVLGAALAKGKGHELVLTSRVDGIGVPPELTASRSVVLAGIANINVPATLDGLETFDGL